jgi:methyl-accepting chemotaxis protein
MADLNGSVNVMGELFDAQSGMQGLLREKDPDVIEKLIAERKARTERVTQALQGQGKGIEGVSEKFGVWTSTCDKICDVFLKGDSADAQYRFMNTAGPQMEQTIDELQKYTKGVSSAAAEESRQTAEKAQHMRMIVLGAVGVVVMVAVGMTGLTIRTIGKALRQVIETLNSGAVQVAGASGQVSSASQMLAQGASEQAASLEETTSVLTEMASMTRKNAETAREASRLSDATQQTAEQGNTAMGRMSAAIDEIQKSAQDTAKIIKVIDEIAFQTNLLALNAAVEAARAGEAGKGFAVVAEEVRSLAMRSAEAAKNTSSLIESSVTAAKNGVSLTVEVGGVLQKIAGSATKVNAMIAEIAAATHEQSQGIDQVSKALHEMDKVTQTNAAGAEESASSSAELASQAEQMKSTVQDLVVLVDGGRKGAEAAVGAEAAEA